MAIVSRHRLGTAVSAADDSGVNAADIGIYATVVTRHGSRRGHPSWWDLHPRNPRCLLLCHHSNLIVRHPTIAPRSSITLSTAAEIRKWIGEGSRAFLAGTANADIVQEIIETR